MADDLPKQVGLKDQPIEDIEQEALGLGEYAEVLTEFIQRCDTPITIALQGDWGSGKTSLMTLIRHALEAKTSNGKHYLTVWFNTWQYSQFNMSDTLALSMMSKITDELASEDGTEVLQTVKRSLWAATRAVAIGGASLIGQADTVKEVMTEAERARAGTRDTDPTAALEKIKEGLSTIVQQRVEESAEKVVVFIDDLDRLIPAKAVELLEAMKIFLDIDKCVYVIACDYSVVAAGLKAKFGLSEGELKGKSFFDKIIQVPFKMPTRRYQVEQYIESLLKQIGMDFDVRDDIDKYRDLVDHSVGFNPRTMKRLLNTLQLLTILEDKRRQRRGEEFAPHEDDLERQRHACRVTFGILCMLERYESIYDFLTDRLTAEDIVRLRDGFEDGEGFEELRQAICENGTDSKQGAAQVNSAAKFIETFVDCLQLDDDERLSNDEIRHLGEMLSQSALVSSGRLLSEFAPREFALELRWELNNRYSDFVGGSDPKYDKFRMSAGEVYLNLPDSVFWLSIGKDDDMYYFEIRATEDIGVYKIGRLICESMGWEAGAERETDVVYAYRFFAQRFAVQDAVQIYKMELFKRLDALTAEREQLKEFVS